jgi:superfamily I DNA/RNA helicase
MIRKASMRRGAISGTSSNSQALSGAKIYKIETNYRSPGILSVANAAIAPNVHQFAKELAPARPSGAKLVR